MTDRFKLLPSVDVLLSAITSDYKREIVHERCRQVLENMRKSIAADELQVATKEEALEIAAERVDKKLAQDFAPSLKPIINATGIILHTGLGRAPSNTVIVEDPFASNEHALLAYREDRWWLEDLGSRNGTLLNGERLRAPAIVATGDEIGIGGVRLRIELGAEG